MITKNKIIFLALILLFFLCNNIYAEWRTYESNNNVATVLEKFLSKIEESKTTFKILKVYNEIRDGVQGFEIILKPQGTLNKLQFFSDEKTKNTFVKVFTQNGIDAHFFENLMIDKMKMKEFGVTPINNGAKL